MRKSKMKILISILVLVCMIMIAMLAIIVIGKKTVDGYRARIDALETEMLSNRQTVYVAISDIEAGETIEDNINVAKQEIYTGLSSESFISYDDIGSIARIDLPYGEPVMKNSVTKLQVTKDTRKYEISVANLMLNQMENDYVDLRIMFPNGEDYTVLSKKPVYNLSLDNCIFYSYLDEDEIMRMASAIIDAYTITGTRIYTTQYVEPTLQSNAVPNYLVKAETLDLINSDPNIVAIATDTLNLKARLNLEARLKGLSEDQLKAVAEGHNLTDTAKSSVLTSSSYNQVKTSLDSTDEEGEETPTPSATPSVVITDENNTNLFDNPNATNNTPAPTGVPATAPPSLEAPPLLTAPDNASDIIE